jgi:hypothetical protein
VVWLSLIVASAVAFFSAGWPADRLSRRPRGISWFALTFCAPVAVWLLIALVVPAPKEGELGGFVIFVGALTSIASVVLGALCARLVRAVRRVHR